MVFKCQHASIVDPKIHQNRVLEASWGLLERLGGLMGRLGRVLGCLGGVLRRLGGVLAASSSVPSAKKASAVPEAQLSLAARNPLMSKKKNSTDLYRPHRHPSKIPRHAAGRLRARCGCKAQQRAANPPSHSGGYHLIFNSLGTKYTGFWWLFLLLWTENMYFFVEEQKILILKKLCMGCRKSVLKI